VGKAIELRLPAYCERPSKRGMMLRLGLYVAHRHSTIFSQAEEAR
jgi:hypothetical protein